MKKKMSMLLAAAMISACLAVPAMAEGTSTTPAYGSNNGVVNGTTGTTSNMNTTRNNVRTFATNDNNNMDWGWLGLLGLLGLVGMRGRNSERS